MCCVRQLGGLIDEAGEDVELYMASEDPKLFPGPSINPSTSENNAFFDYDSSLSPQMLRPRSKRLKQKSLCEEQLSQAGGDVRRKDSNGYLEEGEVRPSDLVPGVKIARAKRGYVCVGEIIQMNAGGSSTEFSLAHSSTSISDEDATGASAAAAGSLSPVASPTLSPTSAPLSSSSRSARWEVIFDGDASNSVWMSWEQAR